MKRLFDIGNMCAWANGNSSARGWIREFVSKYMCHWDEQKKRIPPKAFEWKHNTHNIFFGSLSLGPFRWQAHCLESKSGQVDTHLCKSTWADIRCADHFQRKSNQRVAIRISWHIWNLNGTEEPNKWFATHFGCVPK